MSEFSWWLLIVGLVVGAGLVWLVLADSSRRETEIEDRELPMEAEWIAASMRDAGRPVQAADAEEVLRLHRAYLGSVPPDEVDPREPDGVELDGDPDGVVPSAGDAADVERDRAEA